MRANQVRRLPVLDSAGMLVGIVSLNDIAREAERERQRRGTKEINADEVAMTLGAICQSHATREMTVAA